MFGSLCLTPYIIYSTPYVWLPIFISLCLTPYIIYSSPYVWLPIFISLCLAPMSVSVKRFKSLRLMFKVRRGSFQIYLGKLNPLHLPNTRFTIQNWKCVFIEKRRHNGLKWGEMYINKVENTLVKSGTKCIYKRLRTQWFKVGLNIFTEGWEHNGLKLCKMYVHKVENTMVKNGIRYIYRRLRTQWFKVGYKYIQNIKNTVVHRRLRTFSLIRLSLNKFFSKMFFRI